MSGCPRARKARLLLWVTPALWSSNYVIARAADDVVSGHVLALGRWIVAFLFMLPIVCHDRKALSEAMRSEWRRTLVLGALGMWICGAFVYIGGQSTSATNIGLIYATTPVGIAVAGRWLLHESTSRGQQAAMTLAFAGVVFVIARGDPSSLLQARFMTGDFWIVAAAASWVAYSILQQRWPSRLDPRQRLACMTAGGLLVLLPLALLEVALFPVPPLSPKAFLLMALGGILPGYLSYRAYTFMVRELGATRAGVIMYLTPVYAAFTAWLVLDEAPHWYHAVGAVMIIPSIYLASSTERA